MASTVQQAVATIQKNDYLSLAIITGVGYDYVLTFSWEIEHIWKKPWTRVSTLFVLARYFGLCYAMLISFVGSSFFPGPAKVLSVPPSNGEILTNFKDWCFWIFLCSAELAMILRVWALYNRSLPILGTLLTLYAMEGILLFISYVFFQSQPSRFEMEIVQMLQYSFCVFTELGEPKWLLVSPAVFQIALGVAMCLLTAIRLIEELLQTYKAKKRLELNRYVECLVREGMVYFIVVLIFSVATILINPGVNSSPNEWGVVLSGLIQDRLTMNLVPRFILNLRELYARDVLGGRGTVDTGFGLGTGFERGAVRSEIVFVDPKQTESEEQVDEVEMEVQEVAHTSSFA